MTGMDQESLVADLRAALMKAAERFPEGAFTRHLDHAAADLQRIAPETALGTLTIAGGEDLYDPPADMAQPVRLLWGERERNLPQWDPGFPGRLPALRAVIVDGVRKLQLSPAPSFDLVAKLGSSAPFRYVRRYVIGVDAADTTVPERYRHILLTLAAAFAMQELANRGAMEPTKIGDGFGVAAKNGTPAALAEQLRKTAMEMAP